MKHDDDNTIKRVHEVLNIEHSKSWKDWVNCKIKWLLEKVKELLDRMDKIDGNDWSFNFEKLEPQFYTNLGDYRNAVNQCFRIDHYTNQIIASQADTNIPEGFVLSKLSPSGQYLSKMDILEGGHGTVFGADRKTNGDLKIWYYHERLSKLIQFEYEDNKILTLADAQSLTDFTPVSLRSYKFHVTYDEYFDYLVFYREDGIVQVHNRMDVRNNIDKVIYSVQTDKTEMGEERAFQGITSYGKDIYIFSGWGDMASIPRITKYDAELKEKSETYNLNNITGENGVPLFRDNFREPEGVELYKNPYNDKISLLFCLTTGGHLKRYHMVYGLHQHGAEEHFTSMVKMNAQNYAFTRSDGRAFQILDSEENKSLNMFVNPAYYYIKDNVVEGLKDFPNYPKGGSSWWLEVKPTDQYFTRRQILTRLSYSRKNIQFERTISLANDTVGSWNIIQSENLEVPEYAPPNDWGGKISNIVISGSYYITTPQSSGYSDHPASGSAGYWLHVSPPSSDGRVRQLMERNDKLYHHEYRRLVTLKGVEVNEWKFYDYNTLFSVVVE